MCMSAQSVTLGHDYARQPSGKEKLAINPDIDANDSLNQASNRKVRLFVGG